MIPIADTGRDVAYASESVLTCTRTEHTHSDSCYTTTLTCGQEEHTHSDACYDESGNLICGLNEHTHSDGCYTKVLTCGQEEHTHSAACYTVVETQAETQQTAAETQAETTAQSSADGTAAQEIGTETDGTAAQGTGTQTDGAADGTTQEAETHTDGTAAQNADSQTEDASAGNGTETAGGAAGADSVTGSSEALTESGTTEAEEAEEAAELPESTTPVSSGEREDASVWEQSVAGVTLTGDWAEDIVAIALTQLGVSENKENFTVTEDGETHYYSRYGQWYGDDYTEWSAAFVQFCAAYAGISETYIPKEANVGKWLNESLAALYTIYTDTASYVPQAGDLIFFDTNQYTDGCSQLQDDGTPAHVGIVISVNEETNTVQTVEGNSDGTVAKREYPLNNEHIFGYVSMADIMARAGISTETAEESSTEVSEESSTGTLEENSTEMSSEISAEEAEGETGTESENGAETQTETEAETGTEIETDVEAQSEIETETGAEAETETEHPSASFEVTLEEGITVSAVADAGVLPEGASMSVTLLEAEKYETAAMYSEAEAALEENEISYDGLIALDISFLAADGTEIEPEQGLVTVKIEVASTLLDEDADPDTLAVQHLAETDDGLVAEVVADAGEEAEGTIETDADGCVSMEFTVDSFSYFTVTYSAMFSSSTLTIYLVDENGDEILGSDSLGGVSGTGYTSWSAIESLATDYISQAVSAGYTYEGAYISSSTRYNSSSATAVTYIKYKSSGQDRGWRYNSDSSQPNSSSNGTSIGSNQSIYLVFSKVDSGGSSGGSSTDISPAYSKYVSDNGDGTYDLTLTVTGAVATTEEPAKVDIIYVLDVSGSMAYGMNANSSQGVSSTQTRLYYATSAIKTLTNSLDSNEDLDVQYALVTFSGSTGDGTYNDATTVQGWTDSASTLTSKLPTSAVGGTNYQAGLMKAADLLDSAREGAITVVVFISDGDPSYYYNNNGNTAGSGSSYDSTAMSNAQTQLASMSMNYFISVGVGMESNYTRLENLNAYAASGVTTAFYKGTDSTSLANAFSAIEALITEYAFSNVTVTDVLSENVAIVVDDVSGEVKLTITVTNKNGELVASGVGSVTLSDGTTITATYDETEEKITLDFPDAYELEDGWTYSITATVEVTEEAYENYRENNSSYPNKGDEGTDDPDIDEEDYISSGKEGVYTNKEATLTYDYNGKSSAATPEEGSETYSKPVIQLEFGTLVIEKKIEGLDDVDNDTFDVLKNSLTFTYALADGTGTSTDVKLSDFTYDDTSGTYKYTVSNLMPDSIYTVTESSADCLTSYGYTLDTSNSDINDETVTIVENGTSTASFKNVYTPSTQTVTIAKTVVGSDADKTKDFAFTFTLVDSDNSSYSDDLSAVKSSNPNTSITLVYDSSSLAYGFTLNDGETITFTVPYGYTLAVTETAETASGFSTTVTVNDGSTGSTIETKNGTDWSGKITGDIDIVYTNLKIPEFDLEVEKTYNADLTAGAFQFVLYLANVDDSSGVWTVDTTVGLVDGQTNGAETLAVGDETVSNVIEFDQITYSTTGTYYYILYEDSSYNTIKDVTYDATVYGVKVEVDTSAGTATRTYYLLTDNGSGGYIATKIASETTVETGYDEYICFTSDGVPIFAFTNTYEATADITIQKINSTSDETALTGATFTLTKEENSITYYYDGTNSEWVTLDTGGTAPTLSLDSVKIALAAGTYTLTELSAPDGYYKLSDPVKFTVTIDDSSGVVTLTTDTASENYITLDNTDLIVKVKNTKLYSLPESGKMGTYPFTISGVAILMTALLLFITNKQKEKGG
ncbi:MAG: DUF2272 domain-containing protein [Lachnospiraceae bacterium]|nr:DUF2272 domain-containing protein [Lachnospiraceae bacterium]